MPENNTPIEPGFFGSDPAFFEIPGTTPMWHVQFNMTARTGDGPYRAAIQKKSRYYAVIKSFLDKYEGAAIELFARSNVVNAPCAFLGDDYLNHEVQHGLTLQKACSEHLGVMLDKYAEALLARRLYIRAQKTLDCLDSIALLSPDEIPDGLDVVKTQVLEYETRELLHKIISKLTVAQTVMVVAKSDPDSVYSITEDYTLEEVEAALRAAGAELKLHYIPGPLLRQFPELKYLPIMGDYEPRLRNIDAPKPGKPSLIERLKQRFYDPIRWPKVEHGFYVYDIRHPVDAIKTYLTAKERRHWRNVAEQKAAELNKLAKLRVMAIEAVNDKYRPELQTLLPQPYIETSKRYEVKNKADADMFVKLDNRTRLVKLFIQEHGDEIRAFLNNQDDVRELSHRYFTDLDAALHDVPVPPLCVHLCDNGDPRTCITLKDILDKQNSTRLHFYTTRYVTLYYQGMRINMSVPMLKSML